MTQKILLSFAVLTAFSLTGCQSGKTNDETEALRQQITQLEQQIKDMEDRLSSEPASDTDNAPVQSPEDSSSAPEASSGTKTDDTTPASDPDDNTAVSSDGASALSTTYTMEELTNMVSDYETKAAAAVPGGSASENMDQFLSLKQEEKEIDRRLDLHEDELEYLYRNNSLSREDYKKLERELERLEDRLDDAEDQLEYTFGIDD